MGCGDTIEPIFQPIGRSFVHVLSGGTVKMACQTEYDACIAANPDPASVVTGSVANMDVLYPAVHPNASSSICAPEAGLMAYKKGYNLTADCAAGDTTLGGGGATALALQKCLMKSRAEAGQSLVNPVDQSVYYNCLDIGGTDCGVPYTCTSAPTTTAGTNSSGASGGASSPATASSGIRAEGGLPAFVLMTVMSFG